MRLMAVTQIRKIGLQLDQWSASPGLKLANGTVVINTPEARREDLVHALKRVQGSEG